jgi:hypothetical protein
MAVSVFVAASTAVDSRLTTVWFMLSSCPHETRAAASDLSDEGIVDTFVWIVLSRVSRTKTKVLWTAARYTSILVDTTGRSL